jgi:hypothetical protein
VLPNDVASTGFAAAVTGGRTTSDLVTGGGDGAANGVAVGDVADVTTADFGGTVSTALVSLVELALATVGVEGVEGAGATEEAVVVTAGVEGQR